MDNQLELDIRRAFSDNKHRFAGLMIWAENNFSELAEHDDLIHTFNIREKSIDSLLHKVDCLIGLGSDIKTFEDVLKVVNDIIGARIIVYIPREILSLHAHLVNSKQLVITKVTIHCHEEQNKRLIEQIKQTSINEPIIEHNQTGYFGVHYLIRPTYSHEIYHRIKHKPYNKFELQIRTLMNHAWSEMQHRVVYKSQYEDDNKSDESRFSDLWLNISASEETLDRLCNRLLISPTINVDFENPEFEPMLSEIRKYISEFDQPGFKMEQRYEKAKQFSGNYFQEINTIKKEINDDNVLFIMELAELFLKSGHYKWAYTLYTSCKDSKLAENDAWLWLRLAETCSAFGTVKKDAEVVNYLNRLIETLNNADRQTFNKELNVCVQGSVIAWEYKLLDKAVIFAEKATDLIETKFGDARCIQVRANLAYYLMDSFLSKNQKNIQSLKVYLAQHVEPLITFIEDPKNREHLVFSN